KGRAWRGRLVYEIEPGFAVWFLRGRYHPLHGQARFGGLLAAADLFWDDENQGRPSVNYTFGVHVNRHSGLWTFRLNGEAWNSGDSAAFDDHLEFLRLTVQRR